MPQNNQTLLEKTVADQWQTLPSGLTVLVRPMPGYSSTHVIYATTVSYTHLTLPTIA